MSNPRQFGVVVHATGAFTATLPVWSGVPGETVRQNQLLISKKS